MPVASVLLALGLLAVTPPPSPEPDTATALAVLHRWDDRREAAWAAGDGRALRRAYVAGSSAATADLRLLGEYADRGLLVRRIDTQVFAVEVLHQDPRRLVLRVLDRVAGGEVVDGDDVLPLATSPPRRRTLELVLSGTTWRVRAVSGSG